MQFRLGSDVRQRDGGKAGALEHVVYAPGTKQVASLIVQPSAMEMPELIVPIGVVTSADDESVLLGIDQEQFEGLHEFGTVRNIAPPPDTEVIEEPGLPGVPEELPVGAATGIESIAYTPVLEERLHIAPGDQVIDGETAVYASDGELGKVKQVDVSDETKRITSLIVSHGAFFQHEVLVPMELVLDVREEAITLSAPKSYFQSSRGD